MNAKAVLSGETFDDAAQRRRVNRMRMVDGYPPAVRELIHEYGLTVVLSFLDHGIREPRIVRHLINTTMNELSAVRGANSSQGCFTRSLYAPKGWRLVPEEPTPDMITASVDYLKHWRASLTADERILHGRMVDGRNLPGMPNEQKHASRYRAMIAAAPRP